MLRLLIFCIAYVMIKCQKKANARIHMLKLIMVPYYSKIMYGYFLECAVRSFSVLMCLLQVRQNDIKKVEIGQNVTSETICHIN